MKDIQHLFFDLDHTLWDFEKNSALTFQEILQKHKIPVLLPDFLAVYSPINFAYWKKFREENVTKEALKYGRLKDTFTTLKIAVADDVIHQLADDYLAHLPNHNCLFDGTFEILEYLQTNYKLHIITNGFEEVQSLKLEKSGLKKYFNHVITSETVGVKKPKPKIFEYALKTTGATVANSIMIGDNLEADIQGAISFGLEVIHCNFDNTLGIDKNIVSVASLLEIKQYI